MPHQSILTSYPQPFAFLMRVCIACPTACPPARLLATAGQPDSHARAVLGALAAAAEVVRRWEFSQKYGEWVQGEAALPREVAEFQERAQQVRYMLGTGVESFQGTRGWRGRWRHTVRGYVALAAPWLDRGWGAAAVPAMSRVARRQRG
jgi:hypothetical protein